MEMQSRIFFSVFHFDQFSFFHQDGTLVGKGARTLVNVAWFALFHILQAYALFHILKAYALFHILQAYSLYFGGISPLSCTLLVFQPSSFPTLGFIMTSWYPIASYRRNGFFCFSLKKKKKTKCIFYICTINMMQNVKREAGQYQNHS